MAADDINVKPSIDGTAKPVAVANVGGRRFQIVKSAWGVDDTAAVQTGDTNAARFPVGGAVLGNPDDAAALTDTADTGLISLFKRLLQKFTTQLPATLGSGGGLKVEGTERSVAFQIAAGTGQMAGSTGIDCTGARSVSIIIGSTFDGTQITFNVSVDNVTFFPLRDVLNNVVTQTVTAGAAHGLYSEVLDFRYLRVNAVTNQAGTATDFILAIKS